MRNATREGKRNDTRYDKNETAFIRITYVRILDSLGYSSSRTVYSTYRHTYSSKWYCTVAVARATVCTYVLQTVQHHFKSLKTYSTKIFLMNKNEANNPSLILLHTSLCAVVSTIADSHPEAEGHLGKNKGTRT